MATLVIIKNSKVAGDTPSTLSPGELAINIVDGKLYYGDTNNTAQLLISSAGVVNKIIAGTNVTISPAGGTGNVTINSTPVSTNPGGSNTQIQYNNAGVFGGSPNLTYDGTALIVTGSLSNGFDAKASGSYSHAEGSSSISSGDFSHAEGRNTTAAGFASHAEGLSTVASGGGSHAEGYFTTASGIYSHTEGYRTTASGSYSHAEGRGTIALEDYSHAEGYNTTAAGFASHAEGLSTVASGSYQHVQGQYNLSSSVQSAFIHGNGTSNANRSNLIFAAGSTVQITGSLRVTGSLAITGSLSTSGSNTLIGNTSLTGSLNVSQGITGSLFGTASYALTASYAPNTTFPYTGSAIITGSLGITGSLSNGFETTASGSYSHAEGGATQAIGEYSHAEGNGTTASGSAAHAEGEGTHADGISSHAEGKNTIASGEGAHAEGLGAKAINDFSHAEGNTTTAQGSYSHAEGINTLASGEGAHTEGYLTTGSGAASHAEGHLTKAIGNYSHAAGFNTVASGSYQLVIGQFNISSSAQSAFIIGNGTADNARSNLIFASGSQVQVTGSIIATQGFTGSLFGTASFATSASFAISTSQAISSSFASTASFAPSYLPLTGGTINGNLTVAGTASISYLNVTFESASVIYSSGSNQFGDATNDTQTLIGTVIVSGSQQITGSLNVNGGITGSLFGTSSWAVNAQTASFVTGSNVYGPFGSNSILSSSFAISSSRAVSSSFATTASFAISSSIAVSSSFATTASFAVSTSQAISSSFASTASFAVSSSRAVSSSFAITASNITPAITNTANNRVLTDNGGGTINAESALTFDGALLTLTGSLSQGVGLLASGSYSHAEGIYTNTKGNFSHAEGIGADIQYAYTTLTTNAQSNFGPIEATPYSISLNQIVFTGNLTSSIPSFPYTVDNLALYNTDEGINNVSVDFGYIGNNPKPVVSGVSYNAGSNQTTFTLSTPFLAEYYQLTGYGYTSGPYSHTEGNSTKAIGDYSHAEGYLAQSIGTGSHAEGNNTRAIGNLSHAEGRDTQAVGYGSHAAGNNTVALGDYQSVIGQYNISSSAEAAFIVGNGTADNARSNLIFAVGSTVQVTGSLRVSGSITGSLFGTASFATSASFVSTASFAQTSSFATSASFASTASFAPSYLPLTGGTINGNLTVAGTASISYLNVTFESASVIYSSGSNQFGDATNDVQTLIGTVIVSGSQQITGSLNVNGGITGSLFGTSSFAQTASFLGSNTNAFIQNGNSFGATALLGTNDNQSLALETNATTRMFISSSGNVGIGTTTPNAKLDVNGNTIITGSLTTTNTLTVGGTLTGLIVNPTATISDLSIITVGGGRASFGYNGAGALQYTTIQAAAGKGIEFNVNNSTFGSGSAMTISTAGNVGIGTTTPNAKLDVSGSAIISGSFTVTPGTIREFQVRTTGVDIGNAILDTHTVTGSLSVSGSVTATSFTGSLQGTSSWAVNAITASYANVSSLGGFVQGGNSFGTTATLGTNDNNSLVLETSGSTRLTLSNTGKITSTIYNSANFPTRQPIENTYIDLHPESSNFNILPYYANDIAYNTLRGGTFTGTPGSGSTTVTSTTNIENMFDGAPTYAIFNPIALSGSYTASIIFPQSFQYSNTIGFSFGSTSWRAQNFTVEILVTGSYYLLDTVTNYTEANYNKSFNYSDQAVQGARISFSNFASSISSGFRIADIYLLNYNGQGGKSIFLGRDGGAIYKSVNITGSLTVTGSIISSGSIIPATNNTYNLGTSTLSYSTAYINTIVSPGVLTNNTSAGNSHSWQISGNERMRLFGSTGNLMLQNGGTFTDDGVNRLQISGSARITNTVATPLIIQRTGSVSNINIEFKNDTTSLFAGQRSGSSFGIGPTADLQTTSQLTVFTSTGNVVIQNGGIPTDDNINRLQVSGSAKITNGLTVTGSLIAPTITGSLQGTSSWANNATTASYILQAVSASFAVSASQAISSSFATTSSFITGSNVYGPYGSNSIISSSFAVSSSRAVSSSYALTASYALNGGGGGSGITSLNGLTGAVQTLVTGSLGTNFAISSSGTVHTFNLPDASTTARGVINTGSQNINGTKNFITDIVVNGVNIGAGPGNIDNNVRIGRQAGNSLTSGSYNIFIGHNAANIANTSGSTVIGSNANPVNSDFNQDYTLNIGKRSSLFGPTTQPPHFWSPDRIAVDGNTNDIILRIAEDIYSAVFIDYVMSYEDTSLRAGTIKAVWDKNGVIKWTEDSTDSIGDMSTAILDVFYDSGDNTINLRLTNNSATRVYCNFTSRLLLKPTLN